jgi:hypothetical protein
MSKKLEGLIAHLLGQLMGARRVYDSSVDNPTQLVAILQLKSILSTFETLGIRPFVLAPLVELLGALDDARLGISNPLLTPQKVPGKKPRSGQRVRLLDGIVWNRGVAAVELLLDATDRSKSDVDEALGKVAPILGRLLGGKTVTTEELRSRRKELRAGRGSALSRPTRARRPVTCTAPVR